MGLQRNGNRKKSDCKRNVVSRLLELTHSRNFRKFETLYEIIGTKNENNDTKNRYLEDELNLYKEEILFDFSLLSKKSAIISLC